MCRVQAVQALVHFCQDLWITSWKGLQEKLWWLRGPHLSFGLIQIKWYYDVEWCFKAQAALEIKWELSLWGSITDWDDHWRFSEDRGSFTCVLLKCTSVILRWQWKEQEIYWGVFIWVYLCVTIRQRLLKASKMRSLRGALSRFFVVFLQIVLRQKLFAWNDLSFSNWFTTWTEVWAICFGNFCKHQGELG